MKYNIHKFSFSKYKLLLNSIKSLNIKFKKFNDNLSSGRNIIMRHDIDFCPLRALELAKIEKEYKVSATYFFMTNTNFYNLNSKENHEAILNILKLGHEVGLHFDASFSNSSQSLNQKCKEELNFLESLIKKKINIISFHRPAKNILMLNKKIAKLDHTYMNKFTKAIDYCSDSQGVWKHNTPKDIIKSKFNKDFTLHLLTHPIWWTTPEKLTPAEKIDFHLKKKYSFFNKLAAFNCKPFSKYLKKMNKNLLKMNL